MRAVVEVPPETAVLVTEQGEKYHRHGQLPWRRAACATRFPNGVVAVPRAEAEAAGYDPCEKYGCFGEPLDG